MFFINKPIQKELQYLMNTTPQKKFRVIIKYSNLEEKLIKKITSMGGTVLNLIESINCISAEVSRRVILRISEYPYVRKIMVDKLLSLNMTSTTNSKGIKVTLDSTVKLTGTNVTVGIISSGVYPHVDLLKPHKKIISFKDYVNNINHPYDDYGHGTAISGLISSSKASSPESVLGLSPESHIYMIKAFNSLGKGYMSSVLSGINTFIQEKTNYNIRIVCLPFEMDTHDKTYIDLFDHIFLEAKNSGLIVVVPCSSNGSNSPVSGFSLSKNCIVIGGLYKTNEPYEFTSTYKKRNMKKPDFWFPCVDLRCLNSDITYVSEKNGKKMYPVKHDAPNISVTSPSLSSALVASLLALAFQYNKNYTWNDIYSILKYSSLPKDQSNSSIPIINLTEFFEFTRKEFKK